MARLEETHGQDRLERATSRLDGVMSAPDFSVDGQHVLISGGAGGIGTAFARAFHGGGATVTICDVRPPATDEGFVIIRKANPSGDQATDDSVEVPIKFGSS